MNFSISNITSSLETKGEKVIPDEGFKDTIRDRNLASDLNDVCPITGEVFRAMKKSAANPKNLKITVNKDSFSESTDLYIEAYDFLSFCEASGMNPGEAAEEIMDSYDTDIPEMHNAEIHVVFPSDCLNKNTLGSERFGRDVKNDWAMELMSGCRRYGIKTHCGVNESKVTRKMADYYDEKNKNGIDIDKITDRQKSLLKSYNGSKTTEELHKSDADFGRSEIPNETKHRILFAPSKPASKIDQKIDYNTKHPGSYKK